MIEGLKELLSSFCIETKNISLYETAFTHASYTNEHPSCPSYDRLEFLGDNVLSFVITSFIYEKYPELNSGGMSKLRTLMVEGKTLTDFAENRFHMSSLVRYSIGEKDNTRFHSHIHEDVFESFIGACYLDQGLEFTRRLILDIYAPLADSFYDQIEGSDPKTTLQNLVGENIEYVMIDSKNVNTADVSYTVEARARGTKLGEGRGHNLKEAELNACLDALRKRVGD